MRRLVLCFVNRYVVGILALLALNSAASAHHSFAMFDNSKCVTISGTVRNFEWNFPHSWIWIVAGGEKLESTIWGFEGEPPSDLSRQGWTRTSLKKGDQVTIRFSPLRSGQNGGSFSTVLLPDGKELYGARDACQGAAANGQPLQNSK